MPVVSSPHPTRDFSSREEMIRWNEDMIGRYQPNKSRHPNALIRWVDERRIAKVVRLLDVRRGDTVLDAGCGAGDLLARLPAGILYGIDLSPTLVRLAQRRLGSRAIVVEGDLHNLEDIVPRKQFNKICCTEVLEHLRSPQQVLTALAHLLMTDGVMVLSVPNETFINLMKSVLRGMGLTNLVLGHSVAHHMEREWHLHMFTHAELFSLIRTAGLRVTAQYRVPFSWFPLFSVFRASRDTPRA